MALPESLTRSVEEKLRALCDRKVLPHTFERVKLVYRIRGCNVTLFEQRAFPFDADEWEECKLAQFRYDPKTKEWTLFYADRNSRWEEYLDTPPTRDFDLLVREVEEDPTGIFWR